MKLKFAPQCSSEDALSDGILFGQSQNFLILAKNLDYYNPWFDLASPKKVLRKVCHPKGNEKRNLMALVSVA